MSAGNRIINVRFEDGMYERIVEEVERRNGSSKDAVWTVSDFIRNAAIEKIAHLDRGRCQNRIRKFTCEQCGQKHPMTKIGYLVKPLFGHKEYTCVYCVRVRPAGI